MEEKRVPLSREEILKTIEEITRNSFGGPQLATYGDIARRQGRDYMDESAAIGQIIKSMGADGIAFNWWLIVNAEWIVDTPKAVEQSSRIEESFKGKVFVQRRRILFSDRPTARASVYDYAFHQEILSRRIT